MFHLRQITMVLMHIFKQQKEQGYLKIVLVLQIVEVLEQHFMSHLHLLQATMLRA